MYGDNDQPRIRCYTCNDTRQISKLFTEACNQCGGSGVTRTSNYPEVYTSACTAGCDGGRVQRWGQGRCDMC